MRRTNPGLRAWLATALLGLAISGCGPARLDGPLFELRNVEATGIGFRNTLGYAYDFNVYRYRNFYNGGGVSVGDVSGDGQPDVFFTGNQVPNRLYLNQGSFYFADVTGSAGVAGLRAWSTGTSMVDINGDGLLDIYVCNSGIVDGDDKKNELYINQGNGTFQESAEAYGIADAGLSIDGSFLDYDRDGDLDMYLVNNSYRNIQDFDLTENTRHIRHAAGGDRLYRNPGGGPFTDVSEEAGIYASEIGFGLGVSSGDVNRDGWFDLYISNDFFERDYLYINNRDGTFSEVLEESIGSVSAAAMGADLADLDGDGLPDIFVTDMLPRQERRIKTVTSFDSWERYQNYVADDYHHQFTRNTLHHNRGPSGITPVSFSEVGRMAGVEASDWSWGALVADFDLDGFRDVFVANGIYQDLTDADYLVDIRSEETMAELIDADSVDFETLIAIIPSRPVSNYMFAGGPGFRFKEVAGPWGLGEPGFSNGSAYGDLDGDGDLDLIVNNLNMEPFVYENRATEMYPDRAWLRIRLQGPAPNTLAVGAQITAYSGERSWYVEQQPVRGFQSSVDPILHLGLGASVPVLDSLVVAWPDGRLSVLREVETRRLLDLDYEGLAPGAAPVPARQSLPSATGLREVAPSTIGLDWRHRENPFSDFEQQPLLFHMRSTEGPPVCSGDLDGDLRPDLYLGGAKDQPGTVFLWREHAFSRQVSAALESDAVSEDTDCLFFDADTDGDLDLYVASGGSELPASSSALLDRLYLNDGSGGLERSGQVFASGTAGFEPTGAVASADVDGDGDPDLFLGARLRPFAYGYPADGHLLINDGTGGFREATDARAPALRGLGMITGAAWEDVDGDADPDLVLSREWGPLLLLKNEGGRLVESSAEAGLAQASGWWQDVILADVDSDGDRDLIAGNHGLNSRFRASPAEPVHLWVSDFDRNGSVEQLFGWFVDGNLYPASLRHDLIRQIPPLVRKYPTYASYAGQTVFDVFSREELDQAVHHEAVELRSMIGRNDGQGNFTLEPLPDEAQLAPMYAAAFLNVDGAPGAEILMGGNLYEAKPEAGRYDASFGAVLAQSGSGLRSVQRTGFRIRGQIRSILPIEDLGLIIVGTNNDSLRVFSYAD